jgi:hypothetical protein
LKGILAMLARRLLVDWSVGSLEVALLELLSLPDEVLKQVAIVLRESEQLRLLNDVSQISDELPALRRELLGRLSESVGSKDAVECNVYLRILRQIVSVILSAVCING